MLQKNLRVEKRGRVVSVLILRGKAESGGCRMPYGSGAG